MSCDVCQELLAEGLDLCVRARKMDAIERTNATISASSDGKEWVESGLFEKHARYHNIHNPDRPLITKSITLHLWVQDQYEKDLAEWEKKARAHLTKGCSPMTSPSPIGAMTR